MKLAILLLCSSLAFGQSTSKSQLSAPLSPGEAIKAATQAAAATRQGTGPIESTDPIEILSDTQGVDFKPYLKRILQDVKSHWYHLIPESEQNRKGGLAIDFAIMKDGHVQGLVVRASSGDPMLDRPAYRSIAASDPFPPLPTEFVGPYLQLRFRFYYNPDRTDIAEPATRPVLAQTHAVLVQKIADSNPPKYPKDALDAKIEGFVRLEGLVGTNGQIANLKVIQGDQTLGAAATGAISKWRFQPAKNNGKPIEEMVHINVVFRTEGEQIHTQVFNLAEEAK